MLCCLRFNFMLNLSNTLLGTILVVIHDEYLDLTRLTWRNQSQPELERINDTQCMIYNTNT